MSTSTEPDLNMYPKMIAHTQLNLTEVNAFSPGMTPAFYSLLSKEAKELFQTFWIKTHERINVDDLDQIRISKLPLARIKKIIKMDEDVHMIGSEVPVLFSKAAEIFIQELSIRAWIHTEENRRRTIHRNDISMAVARNEQFDFLIDVVPREDSRPVESNESVQGQANSSNQQSYTESKFTSTNVTQMVPARAHIANMFARATTSNNLVNINMTQGKDAQTEGQQAFNSFMSPGNLIRMPNNSYNFSQSQQQILGQNIRYVSSGFSANASPVSIAQFSVASGAANHLGRTVINSGSQNFMHIGVPINNNVASGNVVSANQIRPTAFFSMNGCLPQTNQHLMQTSNLPYHIVPTYTNQTSNMPAQVTSTVDDDQCQETETKVEELEDMPSPS